MIDLNHKERRESYEKINLLYSVLLS